MSDLLPTIALYALPVVLAITLHEAAHGYVARHFGDQTAYRLGRVSLNPLRHIDPIGTVLVPLAILLASSLVGGPPLLFGWAKPVPVNYRALRNPKADMLWVAAAGPGANLGQALAWALLLKLAFLVPPEQFSMAFALICQAGITVNLVLMVLNLIPILPLDGGRIAFSLLPDRLAARYGRLERFGLPLLLVLLIVHVQTGLLDPFMDAANSALYSLFGLQA
jgi:Zn-dependent protease